jgi:hypothetical protein
LDKTFSQSLDIQNETLFYKIEALRETQYLDLIGGRHSYIIAAPPQLSHESPDLHDPWKEDSKNNFGIFRPVYTTYIRPAYCIQSSPYTRGLLLVQNQPYRTIAGTVAQAPPIIHPPLPI